MDAELAVGPRAHLRDVVGAAGLGTRTHDGLLPTAEGLALDDGAGNPAVDVGVAHLDVVHPVLDFLVVERVDAAGEPVTSGVLPRDGLLEGVCMHDAEHWAEALVHVVPGTRLYVIANARGPQGALLVELLRLEQPRLAWLQPGQAAQELLARSLDEAIHRRGDVVAGADLKGLGGIDKLRAQALRGAGGADEDDERGGGALLARVAERGVVEVRDGQVRVRGRGDDERILAGGLRHEAHLRAPGAEERAGVRGAGEDDGVDVLVGDECLAGLALIGKDELDQVGIEAVLAQAFVDGVDGDLGAVDDLRRRLDDDGRARGERGQHAAHRDGHREVPRRGDDGDLVRGEDRAGIVKQACGLGVVGGEVDGLGDFRVRLRHRLVSLPRGDGDEVPAVVRQLVRDGVEDLRALVAGLRSPLGCQRLGRRDGGVSLLGIGDLFDAVLAWVGGERFLCPLAVGAQRRIRVRLVGKTAGAWGLASLFVR